MRDSDRPFPDKLGGLNSLYTIFLMAGSRLRITWNGFLSVIFAHVFVLLPSGKVVILWGLTVFYFLALDACRFVLFHINHPWISDTEKLIKSEMQVHTWSMFPWLRSSLIRALRVSSREHLWPQPDEPLIVLNLSRESTHT